MKLAASRLLLALSLLTAACATKQAGMGMPMQVGGIDAGVMGGEGDVSSDLAAAPVLSAEAQSPVLAGRKLIWTGELRMDVNVISNAVTRAAQLVAQAKGYIQSQSVDEDTAQLTVRVPADSLRPTISALGTLGSTTVVRVSSSDVTEQYVDTESRMKSARALRDRLEGLLSRATNVAEVLSVERELARVQTEIEATEARLRSMAGQINLATLGVTLQRRTEPAEERRTIYGPVGLLVKGLGWILEKLWVIRE